ncbi:hypothetical protein ERJ75_000077900 [Trypanosoma vivax]|uniref:Uncharacterized protein n=1 Tax=Trypanosoma vivax (strain Y486) TaxID=1055687 RepID=F9WSZ1_TRYVY|nr:hypothetical protein ERJ75_000077900 [Trypanosoma vivax]CCD20680.1 hypothetical protein, conserved in T. vivax [Trypanosoma vivax Y486]|eukprot:CCD20680.1 hypothetical protein, conserved in T. vivax [Trypanosoma vivax Y486]
MKKNSPRCVALRLLTVLWFAVVCRASASRGNPEQKNKEEVFLCGAADLFVEWNVTFGALHKREVKVNTTATKILQNPELYTNRTGMEQAATVAIEMVKGVMSNTSAALNASRGFMDGIERDFFNAFEAVKDYPDNFTFGHSNLERDGKRESEILKFFKNVTMLFVKCKNRTNENVTIDSLEKKIMAEVDNETANLTEWEAEQRDKWNATLANVTTWLDGMKSYNHSETRKNVWKNSVSIRDIIVEDCDKIHRNSSKGSKVPNIINSAYMNVMRHLDDIANKTVVNNSLEENGCNSMHKLFKENISGVVFGNVTKSKNKIQEICKKLNETLQNHTCTTNRTSVEWLRHRFDITVPEIIERLSKSLVQLMEAEKLVVGTFEDLFVSRREVLCDETRVMGKMNTTFDMMVESDASCEADIKSANASLVSAVHNITEARNKSDAALERASMAQNITNAVSTEFDKTKRADVGVKSAERAMKESEIAAREVISKTETSREELKKVRDELNAARKKKGSHLETISKNFSSALTSVQRSENINNVCDVSSFVAPNVSIYAAEDVFAQLVAINFSADSASDGKLLGNCTQKVEALGRLVEEIGVYSNATRDNASKALQHADAAEQSAKEAEERAIDVVKSEINEKWSEIYAAEGNMTALSRKVTELERQRDHLYKNLSVVAELSNKTMNKALVAVRNCTAAAAIAMEAMTTVLKTTNETGRVVDANSSCAKAYANVINEDGAVQRVLRDTKATKVHVGKLHGDVNTSLAAGKSQLEQMKRNFTALSEFTNGGHLVLFGSARFPANINVSKLSLENATKIYTKLRSITAFNASRIEESLTSFGNVVAGISSNLTVAVVHQKGAADNVTLAETKAKEVEEETRAVLKKALEKQRARLCDTVKQLTEINNKTTALQKEAIAVRESEAAQLKRASAANQRAEDAVTRAVAAEPHAAEATAQYQLTGEAFRSARIEAKHLVKNAAASLQANEEHIKKINNNFTYAVKAVSSHHCKTEINVYKSAVTCNVTSGLEESLREIQSLTALMNITLEEEALKRLSLSDKSVKELMQETSRRASAAEAAAAAALKAAEGSKCTPLYLQLLRAVDNRS